jgi:hypothetical protein
MAATWTVELTVKNVPERRVIATGTRTDGEDVDVYSVDFQGAGLSKSEIEATLGQLLLDRHASAVGKESDIAVIVSDSEVTISNWLDSQEV